MYFEPTYTTRQFWTTILISGLIMGLILSATYILLYNYLYVANSFLFSIIYLIPLFGISVSVLIFKHRFVWNYFSYRSALLMSFMIGLVASLLFAIMLYLSYSFLGLESRMPLYEPLLNIENVDNEYIAMSEKKDLLESLLSPTSISLSMFVFNVFLSLVYSLIIAIFAKQKKTE